MDAPFFVVVISSGQGINSDALFDTTLLGSALYAISTLQAVAPSVNAAIYCRAVCVLRVRDGRWFVPMRQLQAAA
jgi:hypothetical protein